MNALLLAAHGSTSEPVTNRGVVRLAAQMQIQLGVPVGVAFHKGRPGFSSALDLLKKKHAGLASVTVVPLMSSSGYYCSTVLPRELGRNHAAALLSVAVTEPVGSAAGLPSLVLRRIWELRERRDLLGEEVGILLVGHGTRRHSQSRRTTELLAEKLRAKLPEVAVAFLDESPSPASALDAMLARTVVVIPFMLGVGPHVSEDLPEQLVSARPGLKIHCDIPVGSYPELSALIVEVTEGAKQWL